MGATLTERGCDVGAGGGGKRGGGEFLTSCATEFNRENILLCPVAANGGTLELICSNGVVVFSGENTNKGGDEVDIETRGRTYFGGGIES